MAKKKQDPKRTIRSRKSDKSGLSGMMMAVVAIGGFGVISPGAAGAIFVCMLPTFVLLFGDSDGLQMMRAQCVGYLNAAAAFPFVYGIYNGDATFVQELMALKLVLIPWGAALIGTFLQYMAPYLASSFLQFAADEKLNKILTTREKLIDDWGPEVGGPKGTGL